MIDVQKELNKIESDWGMSGLSTGLYGDYSCEAMKVVISKLTNQLDQELESGKIKAGEVEFRANQIIQYPVEE